MTRQSLLDQAWNDYRRGRFSKAIERLEPQILHHREEEEFFRVLGLSCLRQGDWKGGETYLRRARQLDGSGDRQTLLGLMAAAARRQEPSEAVEIALELLDRNPKDALANAALKRLREALAQDENLRIDRREVEAWLPPRRSGLDLRLIFALVGSVVALGVVAGLGWWFASAPPPTPEAQRPGAPPTLTWTAAEDLQVGRDFSVVLTPDEVRAAWADVQRAFEAYEDSRARYQINRLLLSNAGPLVKEQARNLIAYLHEPDFSRPGDSSSLAEVKASPILYEGCTVLWKGVIANLDSGTNAIRFDLLVGYQDGQIVEAVVPVELRFAALLKNSQIVEVLGRIELRDAKWIVQASALKNLGYRTPSNP